MCIIRDKISGKPVIYWLVLIYESFYVKNRTWESGILKSSSQMPESRVGQSDTAARFCRKTAVQKCAGFLVAVAIQD